VEYYRPLLFTSLGKHFAYSMNSTLKLPGKTAKDINHSPFLPHSTHTVQHPRLMEGVRRWIGANPTSSPPKMRWKPAAKPEVNLSQAEPELEPHSTELIARRLLEPNISEEEEAEYQGYIDQYQELLDAPTIAERKDLDVYHMAVKTAVGDVNEWREDPPDEAFSTYVERGTTRYLDGSGRKEAFPIVFNYERWLGPVQKGS